MPAGKFMLQPLTRYRITLFIISVSCYFPLIVLAQAATLATITVAYQPVVQELIVDGVVEAVKQATLSAQTAGQVLEVNFDVDDFVKKDEVIVRLKNTEQKASLAQAQAQVGEAQAQLQVAQEEYERIARAFAKQVVAAVEMDRVTATLNAAKARVNAVRANVNRVGEQSGYTVIRAPYSGVVLQRHIQPGEMAAVGQPIMSGFSLDSLRSLATVPQSQIETVRQYKQARIIVTSNQGERSFEGKNITIVPHADPQGHGFKVRVNFAEGTPGIMPGILTKVAFVTGQTQRLLLPNSAVAYRGEVRSVYIVDNTGKIAMRLVRLGEIYGDKVEILSGLQVGEQVAVNPVDAAIALKQQR